MERLATIFYFTACVCFVLSYYSTMPIEMSLFLMLCAIYVKL